MSVDQSAETDVAEAFGELSARTGALVRREIEAARDETWEKAKAAAPAVALLMLSGVLGALGAVCGLRVAVRAVEKVLPRGTAALLGTLVFSAAGAATAAQGMRLLREAPVPLPTETAAEVAAAVSQERHTAS
jgi:protein-S-isoprenylcysteine O-methyltransferase Ste14